MNLLKLLHWMGDFASCSLQRISKEEGGGHLTKFNPPCDGDGLAFVKSDFSTFSNLCAVSHSIKQTTILEDLSFKNKRSAWSAHSSNVQHSATYEPATANLIINILVRSFADLF